MEYEERKSCQKYDPSDLDVVYCKSRTRESNAIIL